MKALAPADVTVGDVFRSSMPFLGICFLVMVLIMRFPQIALWLPNMMARDIVRITTRIALDTGIGMPVPVLPIVINRVRLYNNW